MRVRGIVPCVRERSGNRRSSPYAELPARRNIREVRNADDNLSPHAERLPENDIRVLDLLEALVQDNVIETQVRVFGQTGIHIAVEDGKAVPNALVNCLLINLDALSSDVPFFDEL